ncbi:MAG: twitch domain-containing radical SAM protein [Alphaproteobacteria bacterium]|nr:twitch domain-containing radical SAM protein [Alphaproteobacteria bacterium]
MLPSTFCSLPFSHLQITPTGTVKLCCVAQEEVQKRGTPMSLYSHSFEEIWNSNYMVDVRRAMAEGRQTGACNRCYRDEAGLGISFRTQMNALSSGELGLSLEGLLESAAGNGYLIPGRPVHYQLNMGNLCNLACRMCNSDYSSRIAADPVLSAWSPGMLQDMAKWRGDTLNLGPTAYTNIHFDGFYSEELDDKRRLVRWSAGNGDISFSPPEGASFGRLKATLRAPPGTELTLKIMLNGFEIFFGQVGEQATDVDVDISELFPATTFRLRMLSSTVGVPESDKSFGIGILNLAVTSQPHSGTEKLSLTRFSEPGGWWTQRSLLFGELMAELPSLRRLILQGGESLLNKETPEILDHLIVSGAAQNIHLQIVTNFTQLSDRTLELLSRFKHVELWASVDGIGPVFEYIRYPAKWDVIDRNVARVKQTPNISLAFAVAVQAYNLLNFPDILVYCDRHNLPCIASILLGPGFLSVLVLPPAIRQTAINRIKDTKERLETVNARSAANSVIDFLEQKADVQYCDMIESFMHFTNDLDGARGQSFTELHGELAAAFNVAGHPWDASLHTWLESKLIDGPKEA